jgi:hypothetical protein
MKTDDEKKLAHREAQRKHYQKQKALKLVSKDVAKKDDEIASLKLQLQEANETISKLRKSLQSLSAEKVIIKEDPIVVETPKIVEPFVYKPIVTNITEEDKRKIILSNIRKNSEGLSNSSSESEEVEESSSEEDQPVVKNFPIATELLSSDDEGREMSSESEEEYVPKPYVRKVEPQKKVIDDEEKRKKRDSDPDIQAVRKMFDKERQKESSKKSKKPSLSQSTFRICRGDESFED